MNNKVKKWLTVIIALQIILLVLPAGVKAVNQYITERNAPEKGAEFTFVASDVWLLDEQLYMSCRLTDDYYEYVPRYEKFQLSSDKNGYAVGTKYNGENDFYTYGKYVSLYIPFESIRFSQDYDLQKLDTILEEIENVSEWYFGDDVNTSLYQDKVYQATFTATVYKGLVLPKAFYIDGVEILKIER